MTRNSTPLRHLWETTPHPPTIDISDGALDATAQAHERAALDALRDLAALADTQPDLTLALAATLRRIGTAASCREADIRSRRVLWSPPQVPKRRQRVWS